MNPKTHERLRTAIIFLLGVSAGAGVGYVVGLNKPRPLERRDVIHQLETDLMKEEIERGPSRLTLELHPTDELQNLRQALYHLGAGEETYRGEIEVDPSFEPAVSIGPW